MNSLFKTNPFISKPPLADHVKKDSSSIVIDLTAAKDYKKEVFQFFSSLTIDQLRPIYEFNPIEDKAAWARWRGLAAASPDDPENENGKGVEWGDLEPLPALGSCRGAIDLNPDSPRIQFQYGRVFHKAGRFSEAQAWYRKAADQGYTAGKSGLGKLYSSGLGISPDSDR